jgi:cytochrome c oxidase assembly protein subunit 15
MALVCLFIQIALGGWVSTNYATLACQDFPTCQSQWWPAMDFARGFELWRPLGRSGDGSALPFQALTAIHVAHRLWAGVVFFVVGLVAWRAGRHPGLRPLSRVLLALLALQALTGPAPAAATCWPSPTT